MRQSKQIKSVYLLSPSNYSQQNQVHPRIQKTSSYLLSPNHETKQKSQKPIKSNIFQDTQFSVVPNNQFCAIENMPLETKSVNSAYKTYFSKFSENQNQKDPTTPKQNKSLMSLLSKIVNPYAQESKRKHDTQIFITLEKIYQTRVKQAYHLIKKPYVYVNTIKKSPTFAANSSAHKNQELNDKFKRYLAGKISKQNVNNESLTGSQYGKIVSVFRPIIDEQTTAKKSVQKKKQIHFEGGQPPNSITPITNKMLLMQGSSILQKIYLHKLEQQQKNRRINLSTSYLKTFSILNQNSATRKH